MKIKRQDNNVCQQCDSSKACFIAEAPVDNLDRLVQDLASIKKGEILYRQAEKFQGIYILKQGGLKTFLINADGDQIITGFYLPGDLLGFSGLSESQYIENAEALSDSAVCRVSFTVLMRRVHDDAAYQTSVFMLLSAHFKHAHEARYLYINTTAEQKVAIFLLNYAQRLILQGHDGTCFRLLPTRQDIARFLGITPETMSRILAKFQKNAVFQLSEAKQIEALDHLLLDEIISREKTC